MPKPFASSTTLARRAASGINIRHPNSSSYSPRRVIPNAGRGYGANLHRCTRCFSRYTPKPLARLHEPRDLDSIFFTRASTVTVYSSSNKNTRKNRHVKENREVLNKAGKGSGIEGYDFPRPDGDHKPPDERVVKLGKTLRKLSPLLPNILVNALPTELLSPQITLHLFPSTHPHLPTVKGRVLYRAALWTVPVAWSSLPLLGNVKLQILSERMVRSDSVLGCEHSPDCGAERLVVRWKTEPRGEGGSHNKKISPSTTESSSIADSHSNINNSNASRSKVGVNKSLSTLLGGETPIFSPGKEGQFEGLFIFAFDEQGRIAGHTIEHADQADGWDRTAKFVTLTDWLLGKARGTLGEPMGSPALIAQLCHAYNYNQHRNPHPYFRYRYQGEGSERKLSSRKN